MEVKRRKTASHLLRNTQKTPIENATMMTLIQIVPKAEMALIRGSKRGKEMDCIHIATARSPSKRLDSRA